MRRKEGIDALRRVTSLVQRQAKDMRSDGGKEGEERMRLEKVVGLKECFCLFCFVFRIEETKDVSRQRGRLKMKKTVRLKI